MRIRMGESDSCSVCSLSAIRARFIAGSSGLVLGEGSGCRRCGVSPDPDPSWDRHESDHGAGDRDERCREQAEVHAAHGLQIRSRLCLGLSREVTCVRISQTCGEGRLVLPAALR